MPKPSISESILALFGGYERAAAIYGDLKEMAATRGPAWFVAAYLRTLTDLSWRIIAAVLAGMALRQLLVNTLFGFLAQYIAQWSHLPDLLILSTLWFFLPFAAVLYGFRDRFVRLTAIATLGTTVASLFMPPISYAGAAVTLVLAAFILLLIGWWKQAAVLAATITLAFVSGKAAGILSVALLTHGYIAHYGHGVTGLEPMLAFRGSMLLSAYLCARLHGWLLAPGPMTA